MDKLETVFQFLMGLMDKIIGVLVSLAVLAVLWGIVTYFFRYSPEKRKEANAFIVYGVLSLLVIVSLWGFVYLFGSAVGIKINTNNSTPTYDYANVDDYDPVLEDDYGPESESDFDIIIDDDLDPAKRSDYEYIDISADPNINVRNE